MANMTKAGIAQLRSDLNAALSAVAAQHGIDFDLGIIRFNADGMRCKLTGVVRGAAGTNASAPVDPEAVALARKGVSILGAAFDSTKAYNCNSIGKVTIVGYNTRAKKYPFTIKAASGKRYKISTWTAKGMVAAGPAV